MGISSRNLVKTSPLAPASPFIKKAQPHAVRQASSLGRSGSIASRPFQLHDINKDGVLTGTEVGKLARFDTDKNGKVTKDEFDAGMKAERARRQEKRVELQFSRLDINDDAALSGTEMKKLGDYDADKDGKLTLEEFKAGRSADRKARLDKLAERKFAKADVNSDGVLTGTEVDRVKGYDADGNKVITKGEFKAGFAADQK